MELLLGSSRINGCHYVRQEAAKTEPSRSWFTTSKEAAEACMGDFPDVCLNLDMVVWDSGILHLCQEDHILEWLFMWDYHARCVRGDPACTRSKKATNEGGEKDQIGLNKSLANDFLSAYAFPVQNSTNLLSEENFDLGALNVGCNCSKHS